MNWETIQEWLAPFTTNNIIDYLVEKDLLHNGWFIGGVIVAALISHFLKQRLLTALIVLAAGLAVMISYTFNTTGTASDISGDRIFLFVGTGTVILCVTIYLLFVRND